MMNRRIVLLPALALAATSLSGCVAVAIPAIAGSALVGSRIDGKEDGGERPSVAASDPAAVVAAPAPTIAMVPVPTVSVMTSPQAAVVPAQAAVSSAIPAPAPVAIPAPPAPIAAPAPAPIAAAATPVIAAPTQLPAPAPVAIQAPVPATVAVAAPAPVAVAAPVIAPMAEPALPPPAPAKTAALSSVRAAASYPDPDRPLSSDQLGFARFVRYSQASALVAKGGADLLSAMLSDPVALDGKRRRCAVGEQAVALIDLDPKGGIFTPPANPEKQPGLALGLAIMREAGVEIAWLSDLSVSESGALRTVLEQSDLDPRGEDIISLRRDDDDSKHKRKENLAAITCIVAIAGDERTDFDERFKYLRSPEAGAGLEPVIGNGWFLIEPLLGKKGQ